MHPTLKKSLLKQQIRKKFKNILIEENLHEENLYKAFVEPFTDVIQAAKLGTVDIVSNLMLIVGSVMTISPEKQKARLKNYEDRKKKLETQWEPLMKRTDDALSSGDADLVALAFAPGLYFTSALGAKTYNAAAGVGSHLETLGLKKGIFSLLPGVSVSMSDDGKESSKEEEGKGSLLNKLTALFAGISVAAAAGEGLASAKKKNESVKKKKVISEASAGDFAKDFEEFSENTGLDVQFEKMQEDLLEYYESLKADYKKLVDSRMEFARSIKDAEDYDAFIKAVESLDAKGLDIKDQAGKIKDEVNSGAEKLKSDDEFLETLQAETGKEEVTDQEIFKAATNIVFADLKIELEKQLDDQVEKFRSEIGSEISQSIPDSKTLDMLKSTKKGVELSNLIQDMKRDYSIK